MLYFQINCDFHLDETHSKVAKMLRSSVAEVRGWMVTLMSWAQFKGRLDGDLSGFTLSDISKALGMRAAKCAKLIAGLMAHVPNFLSSQPDEQCSNPVRTQLQPGCNPVENGFQLRLLAAETAFRGARQARRDVAAKKERRMISRACDQAQQGQPKSRVDTGPTVKSSMTDVKPTLELELELKEKKVERKAEQPKLALADPGPVLVGPTLRISTGEFRFRQASVDVVAAQVPDVDFQDLFGQMAAHAADNPGYWMKRKKRGMTSCLLSWAKRWTPTNRFERRRFESADQRRAEALKKVLG